MFMVLRNGEGPAEDVRERLIRAGVDVPPLPSLDEP
jgi:hypothetical protein